MSTIQSGNRYKITNVKGGTVLDLDASDNKSIIGYTYKNGDNQHWEMQQANDGWQIKNVQSGQYLAIEGEAQDGKQVIASGQAFEWQIWPDEHDNSVYRLFVPNTSQNLDLSDHGNSHPGTKVTLWGKWNGKNQTWRFEQV